MPDIKLGTLELVLAKDSKQVRAFQFLHAVDEPGEPGRIGTIIFDQLHHGIGGELSVLSDRYRPSSVPPLAHIQGMLSASGAQVNLIEAGLAADTGSVSDDRVFASSFQWEGDVYFILPHKVIKVSGGDTDWTEVFTPTTAVHFLQGPAVFYNGLWLVGKYEAPALVPLSSNGHVQFDGTTWTDKSGAGDVDVGFFFPVHGGLFAINITSVGARKGQVTWDLLFTDATSPTLAISYVTILKDRVSPSLPTGMHALGRFVLVFGAQGEILAVADAPPAKSLAPLGVLAQNDPEFGHHARIWGSDLMLTSRRGLYALNLDRLAGRDVSPLNIQGPMGRQLFRPSALASMGPDLLVGTRSGTSDSAAVLVLRRYPDGVFYNHLRDLSFSPTISGLHDVTALEYLPGGVITVLAGNATEGRVLALRMPNVTGAPPSVFAPVSAFVTSYTYGPFPGRKLALQVRGFYPEASTNPTTIQVSSDFAPAVVAGTVTGSGPFTFTGARLVGSTFALQIELPAGVGSEWPRLLLPLMLDYAEEPRAGDRIRIAVEVPVGPRRVDSGGDSVEKVLKDLRDLRNAASTITLTLLDVAGTPSTFTVLVEVVSSAEERPQLRREFPSAFAFVDLRVVS